MHDLIFFSLLIFTFLAAGLVKGVTGMGLPTVAMGILGMVMPTAEAAAMLIVPSFVTNVWQLLSGPALSHLLRRLWPMMLGIVMGTVACTMFLVRTNPLWSGVGLGVALIVYAVYALLSPALVAPPQLERWLSPVVGGLTGALTGVTGVFVMPAVPFLQALGLDKEQLVQALGLSFTVSTVALAIGLAAHGALEVQQFGLSGLAIVPALAGMWLGQTVRTRISPPIFKRCFLMFLVLLGLELVSRSFR